MKKIFKYLIPILVLSILLTSCSKVGNMCDIVGHYLKTTVVLPTCDKEGYTLHKCADCNYSFIDTKVDPLGHDMIEVDEVLPTCESDGNTKGVKCSRCDYGNTVKKIPLLGHDIVIDEKVNPTCTESGLVEGEHCTRCDYKIEQEEIKPLGHEIVIDEGIAPTCTKPGLLQGEHCIRCNYKKEQETIPMIDHQYQEETINPTCEKIGYTKYTCSSCKDTYEDLFKPSLGHNYEGISCTNCLEEHPSLVNYKDKVISIFGDSISTFKGYIPVADGFNLEHLPRYPQDNLLTDVNETWWMQIINMFNAKLGINDSWRGATVTGDKPVSTGTKGEYASFANLVRIQNLGSNGNPDVILFYGGTNDLGHVSKVGTFNENKAPTTVDLETLKWDNLADAYVHTLLRLKHYYPNALIICLFPTYTKSYYSDTKLAEANEILASICKHYKVPYVDLRYSGITVKDLPDGIHPDASGMDYITNATIECLLENCNLEVGENIVYPVKHNLTNGNAELHYYKGISKGKTFEEQVEGDEIRVLMNGIDVTNDVYKDGYIYIPNVTGPLEITVIDEFDADGHLQMLPDVICSNTNIWELFEHENIYYTINGWGITSNTADVHSVTFSVTPGDKIWATSFQKQPLNGNLSSSTNAIRIAWFDNEGKSISVSPGQVYSEFVENGYITVPNNVIAVSIPMWNGNSDNEIYILNKEHHYVDNKCICCEQLNLESINLEGKVISIMSASTSTFAGYIPTADGFNLAHRARYPQDNLFTDVKHTWWMQLITNFNAKLGINESWAGSTISNTLDKNSGDLGPDAAMASLTRIKNLGSNGTPDLILFYGGLNDISKNNTFGFFDATNAPEDVDLESYKWDTVVDAFVCAALRIKYFYPNTELVVMLPNYRTNTSINTKTDTLDEELKKVCEYYGVTYVDLRKLTEYKDHLPDGSHPDEVGMDMITELVTLGLLDNITFDRGENTVYSITHNLINGKAEKHYYKGVSKDISFEEQVTGDSVIVKMNGIDVTKEVYKDGYIYIPKVTGPLEITVIDEFDADGHLQMLPDNICSNTNIWKVLIPENIYYTANGWGILTNSSIHSVTFNVTEGDKIWATSFLKAGDNGLSSNATRITWFSEQGLLLTVDRNTVYNEFIKNGYITVPAGAIAVNIPMASNDEDFEIYILNKEHIYEKNQCVLCGSLSVDFSSLTFTAFGDSITYGADLIIGGRVEKPYPTVVDEILGFKSYENKGVSGATLTTNTMGLTCMTNLITSYNLKTDIIGVLGGVNDFNRSLPLGDIDDRDKSTIYGALHVSMSYLTEYYNDAFVFYMTPYKEYFHGVLWSDINSQGYNLEDVANAIKEVASIYNIPVLDLFTEGGFENVMYDDDCDGIHPNQKFITNEMAPFIANFIKENYK